MAEPVLLAELVRPRKGQLLVAYHDWRPSARVFVEVVRVAKDGSWADCRMFTWACSWSKRMPLFDGQFSDQADLTLRDWGPADLAEQEADNVMRLREEGILSER